MPSPQAKPRSLGCGAGVTKWGATPKHYVIGVTIASRSSHSLNCFIIRMDAVLASACFWAHAPRTAPPSAGKPDRLWDSV
ncbi:rCG51974 [Rattus norvegicus]|uniref:RCG51974 n=1 Tax=Rattus norvegicus TaxID=10116 RepID=A6K2U0_RAT|nr:rCG51974 [Rattus norvegicus]